VRSAEIGDGNVRGLSQLCAELKLTELAKTVGDWGAPHPLIGRGIRRELDLVRAALEERVESQDLAVLMLDQALHRQPESVMSDAQRLPAIEAEASGLRSVVGEIAGSVEKAGQSVDLSKAPAAEQRLAYDRAICALAEEMGKVRKTAARGPTSWRRFDGGRRIENER
jgi:hypothetical protein